MMLSAVGQISSTDVQRNQVTSDGPGCESEGVAMHEDQLNVTVDVVRRLISDQFPDWSLPSIMPVHVEALSTRYFESAKDWRLASRSSPVTLRRHASGCAPKPTPHSSCLPTPPYRCRSQWLSTRSQSASPLLHLG